MLTAKNCGFKVNSPNQDAWSVFKDIGSVLFVNALRVIAGYPRPMPDERADKLATILIVI
jgi:hypothetical protein